MKAVIYARYSAGPNQTDQSIEGQLRDCNEFAEKNDLQIINTYIDRSVSGTTDDRAEFQRMLKDMEKHQFESIIVWKVDRFGRNREEIAFNKHKCKKNDVKLMYAKEHIPDGPEGIILESLLEGMAEYYSAELSQKVKRGLRESALKGHAFGNNCMLGYKVIDKKYVIDPLTAPTVVYIFESYANGLVMREIIEELNRRGIRTSKGNAYTRTSLQTVLRNEKYIGIYRYGDICIEDGVPQLIDNELFAKVQLQLAANKRNPARNKAKEEFLLTTKLFCGECRETMIGDSGTSRTGDKHYYYTCSNRKNKKKANQKCTKKNVKKAWIEDLVIKHTLTTVLQKDIIKMIAKRVVEIQSTESINFSLKSLKKQLQDVEKGIRNMVNAIEMGIITNTTRERLFELEKRKGDLEIEIAKEEIIKPTLTEEQVVYWLLQFKKGNIDDKEYKKKMIDTFINAIYIFDNKIVAVYNYCTDDQSIAFEDILLCSDSSSKLRMTGIEPARSPTRS